MKDEKAESAAELRRGHVLEALLDVEGAAGSASHGEALEELRAQVDHLLDQLEAAETMPAKQPPTGVWQVELTNGVVHNFIADHVSAGNGVYEIFSNVGGGPGMTTFMRKYPKQMVTVLAVRTEKVVAYRRLADWDGEEGEELSNFMPSRWATASPTSEQPVAAKTTPGMHSPFATS